MRETTKPFTMYPNELHENLVNTALCDYENRIVNKIIIQTYRYKNIKKYWKYDRIALSQFMKATGISTKQAVSKYLIRLKNRNIIKEDKNGWLGINDNYNEWIKSHKHMTDKSNMFRLKRSHNHVTSVTHIDDESHIKIGQHNNKENKKADLLDPEQKKAKEMLSKKYGIMRKK